nr:hypothetical protein [Tanacetum cinerariifolium]
HTNDDIDIEGDKEEDESPDDDEDDDIDIEGDKEKDKHLAHADSTAVTLPAVDHAPYAEEIEPFETDESAATPPPHPAYREIPEVDLSLRKRLCTAHTGTYELGESSAATAAGLGEPVRDDLYRFVDIIDRGEGSTPATMDVGYGITDAWDDLLGAIQEITPTTMKGVNQRVTEHSTTFDLETNMIYVMIKEKQDDHALQRAQVNRLFRDRRYHAHTASLMEGEARASRTAWAQSMDASNAARSELTAALGCIQILEAARVPAQPEAECQAKNKRKFDDTSRNNQSQQQQKNKRSGANVNTANNQRGNETGQKPTCYECGAQGHFKKDCTKLKNNNHGTQGGNATALVKVYAMGHVGTNPDSNVITGMLLLTTAMPLSYLILVPTEVLCLLHLSRKLKSLQLP